MLASITVLLFLGLVNGIDGAMTLTEGIVLSFYHSCQETKFYMMTICIQKYDNLQIY